MNHLMLRLYLKTVKKILMPVDNSMQYSEKRVQMFHNVREHLAAGFSLRQIAKILQCSRNTVRKYAYGDFDALCRRELHSSINRHYDYIVKSLSSGMSRADTYKGLTAQGYPYGKAAAYYNMNKIIQLHNIEAPIYKSSAPEEITEKKRLQKYEHMSRSEVFRFLWMNAEIPVRCKEYLMRTYPRIWELYVCIK